MKQKPVAGFFAFTRKSRNQKTGPIPVSTSNRSTCPPSCPFMGNGCYAEVGYYTRLHWDKVTEGERGTDYNAFCRSVSKLPAGTLWRHNIAGDLVGDNDVIDKHALHRLVAANYGRRGFTYTHYPMRGENIRAVKHAIKHGFTVNVSANSPKEAAKLAKKQLPTVCVAPIDQPKKQVINGVSIIVCPATYREDITCSSCKLCSVADRQVVVAFPAHGSQSKKADLIARG